MNYTLKNGLFILEDESDKSIFIPAMDEDYKEVTDFEKTVSPRLVLDLKASFEVSAKFSTVNMSVADSYGIYLTAGEENAYIQLRADGTNAIESGYTDLFEIQDPVKNTENDDIYLKLVKYENEVSMYYSEDGKNYIKVASHQFDQLNDAQVAFGLSSFWGGGFMIEISDISVNELSVIYTDKRSA